MAKFKEGDKVVFNGSITEVFMEDFTIGQEYTVVDPCRSKRKGGISIVVAGEDGRDMIFMYENNFDLAKPKVHKNKFKKGDEVVITDKDGLLGKHGFDNGDVVTITADHHSRNGEYDGVATEYYYAEKGMKRWYIHDGEIEAYQESKPTPVEIDSQVGKRKLVVATFEDRKGNEVTIKRSKCRHYYLKKTGKPQRRVHKSKLGAILGELAATL